MAAEERAERAEVILGKILLPKWLRLQNVEVRMKWILKVFRLEEVAGAALRMDIRSQQNVELFLIQGESKVANRMALQGQISRRLRGSGWNERQELPSGWSFKGRRMLRWSEWKERPELHSGLNLKADKMLSA